MHKGDILVAISTIVTQSNGGYYLSSDDIDEARRAVTIVQGMISDSIGGNEREDLRSLLIDSGSPEYGDAVIDKICYLFNFPDTNQV